MRSGTSSCGLLINVMMASEHRNRDDHTSLITSMRRAFSRCAGGPLSQRSMRAPVVEIADIFGQDPLQMALIEDEHVVQALGSDGSHPAFGMALARGDLNGVRTWAIPILRTRRWNVAP
jgi:hypothetical protein